MGSAFSAPYVVPDATGRTALVTGANCGLGFESALAFAKAGASVILACRSQEKGDQAMGLIRAQVPEASLDLEIVDLGSFASVRALGERLAAKNVVIDVLMNNAGVMALPERQVTEDGNEVQLQVNHLSHFLLTSLVLPLLSPAARVVSVSSVAHKWTASVPFDDLQQGGEGAYGPWSAYAVSKVANLLFTRELNKRLSAAGKSGIVAVAAHPGITATELKRHRGPSFLLDSLASTADQGALSQLRASLDPTVKPNDYFGPRFGPFGAPVLTPMSPLARDDDVAARLWDASVAITGAEWAGM